MQHLVCRYCRAPFIKGYKLRKWEVRGNHFHTSTLVSSLQSAICVMIEFLLIFDETNFMEVAKIHEICRSRKKVAYSNKTLTCLYNGTCSVTYVYDSQHYGIISLTGYFCYVHL